MQQRMLAQRMLAAARLDSTVYDEVEGDPGATAQAALVVVIVALCAAIGNYYQAGSKGALAAVIGAFVSWMLWAGVTYVVGTRLFKGTATWGELLRTLGFAQSPGMLAILGVIPYLGRVAVVAASVWQLVAGVVAIRQALDFDTTRAVATAVIAWVVVSMALGILAVLIVGAAFLGSALAG